MSLSALALTEAPRRAPRYEWTPEREARLMQLCATDAIFDSIAETMMAEFGGSLTRKAAACRANKLGYARQISWPAEHIDALQGFIADPAGYSYSIIADKLNEMFGTEYTRNAIIGRLHRLHVVRLFRPKTVKRRKVNNGPRPNGYAKRVVKVAASVIQVRCEQIEPRHVPLVDVTGCRWPYGEGPYTFCDHPKQDGSSYCPTHRLASIREPREAA